jgi:hypothetical protein
MDSDLNDMECYEIEGFEFSEVLPVDEGPEPIQTTPDEKVVSQQQEEEGGSRSSFRADVEPHGRIHRGPNNTPKGKGRDSKRKSPDPRDSFNYEENSISFRCLGTIGYKGIALGPLGKVMDKVHEGAVKRGIAERLTHRNRMARRRKPCAFHWLDENWRFVEEIFKTAVQEVLGDTSGLKRRGRPKLLESNP